MNKIILLLTLILLGCQSENDNANLTFGEVINSSLKEYKEEFSYLLEIDDKQNFTATIHNNSEDGKTLSLGMQTYTGYLIFDTPSGIQKSQDSSVFKIIISTIPSSVEYKLKNNQSLKFEIPNSKVYPPIPKNWTSVKSTVDIVYKEETMTLHSNTIKKEL